MIVVEALRTSSHIELRDQAGNLLEDLIWIATKPVGLQATDFSIASSVLYQLFGQSLTTQH